MGEETWPSARVDWSATESPGLKRKVWESVHTATEEALSG